MIQRLQTQLIFLLIAFTSLVVISLGVTYGGLQAQRQDALIINLAGRQRMLAQQLTRLALQLQNGDGSTLTSLQESEQAFSQTLAALRNGGTAPYLADRDVTLPPTQDPQLLAALAEEQASWDTFRATLEAMTSSASASTILQTSLEGQSDDLVQKADAVVRLYENTSTAKVNRLRASQVTFLACALVLLTAGAWPVRLDWLDPAVCSLEYRLKIIGRWPFFRHWLADVISPINELSHDFNASVDERISFEGDEPKYLYLVALGNGKLVRKTEVGREVLLDNLPGGNYFGSLSRFGGHRYWETALAQTDGRRLRIAAEDFEGILMAHPDVTRRLLEVVSQRLAESQEIIKQLSTYTAEPRIAAALMRLASKLLNFR